MACVCAETQSYPYCGAVSDKAASLCMACSPGSERRQCLCRSRTRMTNSTLYFEALNYNIAQSVNNSLITTALAGLSPTVTVPITAANLDQATPTLEQYGVLPVTVTAAAVADLHHGLAPRGDLHRRGARPGRCAAPLGCSCA